MSEDTSTSPSTEERDSELYSEAAYQSSTPSGMEGRHWLVDLTVQFRNWLGLIVVGGGFLLATEIVTIPEWLVVFGQIAAVAWVGGHVFGTRAVDALHDTDKHNIVDLSYPGDEYAEFEFGEQAFGELTVCGGSELMTRRTMDGELYFGRDLRELDEGEVDEQHPLHRHEANNGEPVRAPSDGWYVNATWQVSADDMEMMANEEAAMTIKEELEQEVSQLLKYRVRTSSMVRDAVEDIVPALLRDLEEGTMRGGEVIQEKIDKHLSQSRHLTQEGGAEGGEGDVNPGSGAGRTGSNNPQAVADGGTDE